METFSVLLALCAGNNSPHKGQWRGALMFSLICAWINDRVNNCEAGDLRCHRAHYNVIVMGRSPVHQWHVGSPIMMIMVDPLLIGAPVLRACVTQFFLVSDLPIWQSLPEPIWPSFMVSLGDCELMILYKFLFLLPVVTSPSWPSAVEHQPRTLNVNYIPSYCENLQADEAVLCALQLFGWAAKQGRDVWLRVGRDPVDISDAFTGRHSSELTRCARGSLYRVSSKFYCWLMIFLVPLDFAKTHWPFQIISLGQKEVILLMIHRTQIPVETWKKKPSYIVSFEPFEV